MFKFVVIAACLVATSQAGVLLGGGSIASSPALGAPLLGRVTYNAPEVNVVKQQVVVDQPEYVYRSVPTVVQTAPIVKTTVAQPVIHQQQVVQQVVAQPALVRSAVVAQPQLIAQPQLLSQGVAINNLGLGYSNLGYNNLGYSTLGYNNLGLNTIGLNGLNTIGLNGLNTIGINGLSTLNGQLLLKK